MFRSRRRLSCGLVLAALLLAACGSAGDSARAASLKPDKDRKRAPNFSLRDASGNTVRLSDYQGKIVLLNFWATWCGPCRIEIPWFIEFEQKYKDEGFSVLGVAMDEDGWSVVRPYISRMKVNYRVLMGDDEIAALYGGVEALPTSFLIDREGKVASVHVGLVRKATYENEITQLLESPASRAADGTFGGKPAGGARSE